MNKNFFIISISLDEFSCLHDSSNLYVDWNRLIPYSKEAPPSVLEPLILMRLPEFMERDEHNMLLLVFKVPLAGESTRRDNWSRRDFTVQLQARDCCQVIPTTERAKLIHESRFSGRVILSNPVFDEMFEKEFTRRNLERSLTGAEALVCCLAFASA